MIPLLLSGLAGGLGFFVGVSLVALGLRRRVQLLDREELELRDGLVALRRDREELRRQQREHFDQVVAFVERAGGSGGGKRALLQ